ncbi:MAG: bifunctional phosphopantothenoylcysteine decarboxylase/phosphopantothenate--cysteine ligase CoaBC [bacterium]
MRNIIKDKNILFILTGSIAIYKSCDLISRLIKEGAIIDVIMTENATKLISPKTIEAIIGRRVRTSMFDDSETMPHITLSEGKGLLVICPATANIIAKSAVGIADDLASTTILSFIGKKIIAPAMNNNMYLAPQTQRNLSILRELGCLIIEPGYGRLACGMEGVGRLADIDDIYFAIEKILYDKNDLLGKRVIVTSGATKEDIDSVRFISNRSSGLMGKTLAEECVLRGGVVTYIYGHISTPIPRGCSNYIKISETNELLKVVKSEINSSDILFMVSAVSDFTVEKARDVKIKRGVKSLNLKLIPTPDILKEVSANRKKSQVIVGFALESGDIINSAKKKLVDKNIDVIIGNPIGVDGAGIGEEENIIYIITKDRTLELKRMDKYNCAREIVDFISANFVKK